LFFASSSSSSSHYSPHFFSFASLKITSPVNLTTVNLSTFHFPSQLSTLNDPSISLLLRLIDSKLQEVSMADSKWIIYPPQKTWSLESGDDVFIKTKSKKESGRKGRVVAAASAVDERVMVKITINGKKSYTESNNSTHCKGDDDTDQGPSSFYTASFRPNRLVPIISNMYMRSIEGGTKNSIIVVTRTTEKYRLLAASQLRSTDHVLEIGCSNGECSLVIAKYLTEGRLVGLDVSNEMVQQAKSKLVEMKGMISDHVAFHVVDPFGDPRRALILATAAAPVAPIDTESILDEDLSLDGVMGRASKRQKLDKVTHDVQNIGALDANYEAKKINGSSDGLNETHTRAPPDAVFIDIGGNRDLTSVVKMLAWVRNSFNPRLCIIKSEEMVDQMKIDDSSNSNNPGSLEAVECTSNRLQTTRFEIEPDGTMKNGQAWFDAILHDIETNPSRVSTMKPRFAHPKKAPLSLSPIDGTTPICRYHNWHKNGCIQNDCKFDHTHCHWCLTPGHRALACTNADIKD
jgi:SAM-dependent methyltransferase